MFSSYVTSHCLYRDHYWSLPKPCIDGHTDRFVCIYQHGQNTRLPQTKQYTGVHILCAWATILILHASRSHCMQPIEQSVWLNSNSAGKTPASVVEWGIIKKWATRSCTTEDFFGPSLTPWMARSLHAHSLNYLLTWRILFWCRFSKLLQI